MRMWAAGSSARGDRLSLVLLLAVLLLVALAAFLAGPVPVLGNLHDLFIPFNAAAAVRQDMALHGSLHSPFGWVYFQVNAVADLLQSELAPDASRPGMLLVSGVVFFVPVLVVWAGFRLALSTAGKPRVWLLPFILALMTAPRAAFDFTHKNLLWYGLYNNHNWGLLLVQLAAFAGLVRTGGALMRPTVFALMSSACLYLTSHYKVSFFLASGLVLLASLTLCSRTQARIVFIQTSGILAGALLLTLAAGYDYPGYVADLLETLAARDGSSRSKGLLTLVAVLVFVVMATSAAGQNRHHRPERTTLAVGLVTLGVLLATLGDWSRYWGYLVIAAALVVLHDEDSRPPLGAFKTFAVLFLVLNFVLNILSLTRVIQLKGHPDGKAGFVAKTVPLADGGDLSVLAPSPEGATPVDVESRFGPQSAETWATLAVSGDSHGRVMPKYSNAAYMDAHQEAAAWLAALPPGIHAGEVEFANALPLLGGFPLPRGHHWLHLDATVSRQSLDEALAAIREWDVVLLPVASVDGMNQIYLNCAAMRILEDMADVGFVRATPHYIYLARTSVPDVGADVDRWRELAKEVILPACRGSQEIDR